VIEIVYSTDTFKELKKNVHNSVESYEFEIGNSFDRGNIIGGFIYFSYLEQPEKNKLYVYSKAEIEKRKPTYASVEFWGGDKDKWEINDKGKSVKVGTIKVEGWYKEMVYKTLCRIAYDKILIDPAKIDDDLYRIIESSIDPSQAALPEGDSFDGANSETIDIESTVVEGETQAQEVAETPGESPVSPELPSTEPSF